MDNFRNISTIAFHFVGKRKRGRTGRAPTVTPFCRVLRLLGQADRPLIFSRQPDNFVASGCQMKVHGRITVSFKYFGRLQIVCSELFVVDCNKSIFPQLIETIV